MAVRVGHEREDFRSRRAHKHLTSDPPGARVDLNHRVSHGSHPQFPGEYARIGQATVLMAETRK